MRIKDLCIEIHRLCTNECNFCSSNAWYDHTESMSLEDFKKTIESFTKRAEIDEVQISGGEPFEHKDIKAMVEYCKKKGLATSVYTSAIIRKIPNYFIAGELCRHIPIETLKAMKKLGLDKIVFDMPAVNETVYKQTMNNRNLPKNSTNAVKVSMEIADYLGIETEIHFVPMKPNFKELEEIATWVQGQNFKRFRQISLLRFVPQGRGEVNKNELLLSEDEFKTFMEDVETIKSKSKVPIRLGIPLTEEKQHDCTAGHDKFLIGADGVIYPCPAFKCGNTKILEQQGAQLGHIDKIDELVISNCKRKTPLCNAIHKGNISERTWS